MDKSNLRIFIVDDNLKFRVIIKEFLKVLGYNRIVGEAESGEVFLEKFDPTNTDLILLDINMPKMNGIETAKRINKEFSDQVKIIALSQHDEFIYMKSMLEAGTRAYVNKTELGKYLKQAIIEVMQGKYYFPEL
jgi:DNA-binding NarL/FixJ family response regulator